MLVSSCGNALRGGHQLCGVHGAEGIRWEVTKPAIGPVNVLHTAITIIAGGRESQPAAHFLIPQRGNILHLDVTIDQRSFNLIAQDNMRRIADLVSIHADITRLNALVPAMKFSVLKAGCSPKR